MSREWHPADSPDGAPLPSPDRRRLIDFTAGFVHHLTSIFEGELREHPTDEGRVAMDFLDPSSPLHAYYRSVADTLRVDHHRSPDPLHCCAEFIAIQHCLRPLREVFHRSKPHCDPDTQAEEEAPSSSATAEARHSARCHAVYGAFHALVQDPRAVGQSERELTALRKEMEGLLTDPQAEEYSRLKQEYLDLRDSALPLAEKQRAQRKRAMLTYLLGCMKANGRPPSAPIEQELAPPSQPMSREEAEAAVLRRVPGTAVPNEDTKATIDTLAVKIGKKGQAWEEEFRARELGRPTTKYTFLHTRNPDHSYYVWRVAFEFKVLEAMGQPHGPHPTDNPGAAASRPDPMILERATSLPTKDSKLIVAALKPQAGPVRPPEGEPEAAESHLQDLRQQLAALEAQKAHEEEEFRCRTLQRRPSGGGTMSDRLAAIFVQTQPDGEGEPTPEEGDDEEELPPGDAQAQAPSAAPAEEPSAPPRAGASSFSEPPDPAAPSGPSRWPAALDTPLSEPINLDDCAPPPYHVLMEAGPPDGTSDGPLSPSLSLSSLASNSPHRKAHATTTPPLHLSDPPNAAPAPPSIASLTSASSSVFEIPPRGSHPPAPPGSVGRTSCHGSIPSDPHRHSAKRRRQERSGDRPTHRHHHRDHREPPDGDLPAWPGEEAPPSNPPKERSQSSGKRHQYRRDPEPHKRAHKHHKGEKRPKDEADRNPDSHRSSSHRQHIHGDLT